MSPNSRSGEIDYSQMGEAAKSCCKGHGYRETIIWISQYNLPQQPNLKREVSFLFSFASYLKPKIQDIDGCKYKHLTLYLIEYWEIFIAQNFSKSSRKVSLLIRIEAVGKFGINLWEIQNPDFIFSNMIKVEFT